MRNAVLRNAAFLAAGGFAAVLFIAGAAQAITDNIFKYTSPKTGNLMLHNMAFAWDGTGNGGFDNEWGNGIQDPAGACFNAGFHLPQGTTITGFVMYGHSSGGQFTSSIHRRDVLTGADDNTSLSRISPTHPAHLSAPQVRSTPTRRLSTTGNTSMPLGLA